MYPHPHAQDSCTALCHSYTESVCTQARALASAVNSNLKRMRSKPPAQPFGMTASNLLSMKQTSNGQAQNE